MLSDGTQVIGVRTGDKGIGRHGEQKPNFEPGADILAKVTIFADGVRGNLTKELIRTLQLGDPGASAEYAIGLKEIWEVPADRLQPGTVIHTLGYPLREEEFGGSFLYAMPGGRISIGFVVGLSYKDPLFDPHAAFQRFKLHPFIRRILEGGQMVRYGAKALPGGRLEHAAAALLQRRAHRRRRGELRELDAAQGHPSRDAQRHARGRSRLRRRARRRRLVRLAAAATRSWSTRARSKPSSIRSATSIRRSARACTRGRCSPGWRWSPAGGWPRTCTASPATRG